MMPHRESRVVVLDASALIAVQNPSDRFHDSALTVLDELSDCEWLIHPLTHIELLVGPARAGGAEALREAHSWFERFGLQVSGDVEAIDLRAPEAREHLAVLRAVTLMKLPDAAVLHLALARNATLVTGDRRLAGAARDHRLDVEEL